MLSLFFIGADSDDPMPSKTNAKARGLTAGHEEEIAAVESGIETE
jgi:hypothetical protein